ncbi:MULTISPECIES: (3R)-hydroxyacyl-ACP dehydratase subunit HadA [unclassified Mycobacterium]|uniref:(3R)-hydroxyacyl-ACP dehydratase subunit HadA n=1 Tax=unclassified Mycobacterium TaxID=2642494 RepID=UPI0007400828|nr:MULTISPECIES: (3R)-hydroxyacyl-ACP dehydratase subunit HadA [unclassified Mycobacterium]KUH81449.1 3-hydroxyacyl-ACP dehydratase [Mycobacterium sp. GA-0227b]KUH83579.1 3-hydroxyacyl-ACP dehydratase [Mycobacterium sp. GA-1999]KUH84663.1 3-hydroxyacyl-ACP dehydratase [Mycobacterium sp. IS-1556]
MSLTERIVGMHYRYPDHYVVGREKIREYAVAVKNDDRAFFDEEVAAELGHKALPAPLTFTSVLGYMAQTSFFEHANVEIKDAKIVQVDQVLKYVRPIFAGDKLYCDVYVDSVRQAHGTDIVVLKNVVTNEAGDVLQETFTTLAGRTGDGEEGFSDATA